MDNPNLSLGTSLLYMLKGQKKTSKTLEVFLNKIYGLLAYAKYDRQNMRKSLLTDVKYVYCLIKEYHY